MKHDPPSARENTRYGPEVDQVIEHVVEHRHSSGTRRVALIHGGFWKPQYDREHLRPMAISLCDNGFDVALIEYRRPQAGRWSAISADIRDALASLEQGIPTVVVGHSAGGQLAVWALHQEVGASLRGAVSLAGCLDLQAAYDQRLGSGAVEALFGGPPLSDADPMQLAPPPAPVTLIHGRGDEDIPVQISRRYAAATGSPLHEFDGDHWPLVTPGAEAFEVTVDCIRKLFRE